MPHPSIRHIGIVPIMMALSVRTFAFTIDSMKKMWLVFALIGVVVPFYFATPFFVENGFNFPLFLDLLLANNIAKFFVADLVVSSGVFLVWSYQDAKKLNINGWWMILVANCLAGLSLALPLYLYRRHRISKNN